MSIICDIQAAHYPAAVIGFAQKSSSIWLHFVRGATAICTQARTSIFYRNKTNRQKTHMNLNKVMIAGRLTRDVELRHTPKGTPVAEIGLAINRFWTEEGQKHEETTFVDVTLWNRAAEIAQVYLRKGSPVFIEGRLRLDTWELGGEKRSRLRVVGESLQLLGTKEGSAGGPPPKPERILSPTLEHSASGQAAPNQRRADPLEDNLDELLGSR
jgi:single-strand DNA-binding protein